MEFHFRQYVLFVLMPFVVMVTVVDVVGLLPGAAFLERTGLDYVVAIGAMGVLYVFAPLVLRYVWKTRRMEEGPLRQRLHRLCERAEMGRRDILVWETMGGHVVNACVAGIIAPVRYVMVTDALVDALSPDEIEAVFAHEIGHVKLHHMVYYALFALGFLALFILLTSTPFFVTESNGPVRSYAQVFSPESLLLVGLGVLYWGLAFGFISRRMEAEADVYAVELTGSTLDFVNALERISFYSGRARNSGSWRHFSTARRTGFLKRCLDDPRHRERFQTGMSVLRWAIVSFAVISVAAAASVVFFW